MLYMDYLKKKKPKDAKGRFIKRIHYSPGTEFKKGQPPRNFGRGQFKKGHPGYLKHPNRTSFKKGDIPWMKEKKGIHLSPRTEFKKGHIPWTKGRFGEKASNWKEGRTIISVAIRRSKKYNEWRIAVYAKDNFTCQICRSRGGDTKLEAHHLKSFAKILEENNIKTIEKAMKCRELWDSDNGFTFCNKCHNLIRHGRRKI